ncbi:hypothetical protein BGX29_007603 [Mortierella sp. GBA35]|nr:hypothetical protein BGX23_006877 [Mortierella sp. AD031]KAF9098474.1 hypothetical protein BGX29_007603 [Mortierella sp. GBA35]KAG0219428.1 hypothetical protein BGX33_003017 [Mortierella sp. NVP41]
MIFSCTTYTAILATTLAVLSFSTPTVEAHSWAACIDWKFNKSGGKQDWTDKGGKCLGYARRYPLGKAFWSLDDMGPSRHYQQDHDDPDKARPCANHKDGQKPDIGSDETRANPPSKAYGGKYGRMTVTSVGDTLCVRWPAKNHAESNEDNTVVQINLSKNKNGKDPSQQQLLKNMVTKLPYKNCNKGSNSDRRACGGCFKVPVRAQGIYLLQWRWELNDGEWYTSCADIEIGGKK